MPSRTRDDGEATRRGSNISGFSQATDKTASCASREQTSAATAELRGRPGIEWSCAWTSYAPVSYASPSGAWLDHDLARLSGPEHHAAGSKVRDAHATPERRGGLGAAGGTLAAPRVRRAAGHGAGLPRARARRTHVAGHGSGPRGVSQARRSARIALAESPTLLCSGCRSAAADLGRPCSLESASETRRSSATEFRRSCRRAAALARRQSFALRRFVAFRPRSMEREDAVRALPELEEAVALAEKELSPKSPRTEQ